MRLLDRYLLRELLVPLAYCLGGFLIFYVAFDLIFEMNRFQEAHLNFNDAVEYYVVTLPEILSDQVIPVSLLLAALYALTTHSRHNELTAMRAAGVSLWRLALPYLWVGVAGGAIIFALNEYWVPQAADKSKDILESHKPGYDSKWLNRVEFHNEAEQRHWVMDRYNRETSEMSSPKIAWQTTNGESHFISAKYGFYANGLWHFYNAQLWEKKAGSVELPQSNTVYEVYFSETPKSLRTEIKIGMLDVDKVSKGGHGAQLSISELLDYLRWHPHLDPEKRLPALRTQLQSRLAAPFTCLAVILIALPFGARTGRQNVFVGVAGSIFICFAYFVLQRISVGLGVAGYINPFVAAWLPNILFSLAGIVMICRAR